MRLYTHTYYNPFFVEVKGREYQIDYIAVFDASGIIASVNRGWFGGNNNHKELLIDVDCVLKRKEDFSLKTAFIIKSNSSPYCESTYALYIPNSVLVVCDPSYEKIYDSQAIRETIKSTTVDGIVFEKIYWVNNKVSSIKNRITDVGKEISTLHSDILNKLPNLIGRLQRLASELAHEEELLKDKSIEECLSEFKKGI